jgi:glycosyltransferase involved in cell wall biosynthesis
MTIKQNELITVVVPVHNCFDYLDVNIKSIISQTYSHIEIIIINDGSTDGSDAKCKEYANRDSRIKYIEIQNNGVSVARNIGINKANGKYITFIDADDWVSQDYIEVLHNQLILTGSDISMCGITNVREDGGVHYTTDEVNKTTCLLNKEKSLTNFIYGRNIGLGVYSKLYKRDLIIWNKISFPVGWKNAEDAYFLIDCLTVAETISVNSLPLYFYLKRKGSASHRKFLDKHDFNIINLFDKSSGMIEKDYPNLTKACAFLRLRSRMLVLKKAYKVERVEKSVIKELKKYLFRHLFLMLDSNIKPYDKAMLLLLIFGKKVFRCAETFYFRSKHNRG